MRHKITVSHPTICYIHRSFKQINQMIKQIHIYVLDFFLNGRTFCISFHKSRLNGVHNTHSTVNFTCCTHCLHMMTEQRTKLMQLFGHRSGCEILVWHHPDLHLPGALCANHSSSEHFQHQLTLKVTLANCPPLETH